ncbi:hypothetical protein A2389_00750 [Candidatus Adlerbacteria bacterium RIFOXYB1_FULL_48_10]|nr:MAG: hypothetical protein A2389_00750 [Candidatus Adlerbacteria bacterium RIFOXYB1_FULL_48_10]
MSEQQSERVFVKVFGLSVPVVDPERRGLGGNDVELSFTVGNLFLRFQRIGNTWRDGRRQKPIDSRFFEVLGTIMESAHPVMPA